MNEGGEIQGYMCERRDTKEHVGERGEIQGNMWMGKMRWKDTCGWGE